MRPELPIALDGELFELTIEFIDIIRSDGGHGFHNTAR